MAMHMVEGESVGEGIRRLLLNETASLITALDNVGEDPGKCIHESRKACKRARALLRIIRPCAEPLYKKLNPAYRDIARSLSTYRDAEVKLRTLGELTSGMKAGGAERYTKLREQLTQDAAKHEVSDQEVRARDGAARAREIQETLCNAKLREDMGFATIERGLRTAYGEGRRAMKSALEHPYEIAFHEWRKRVKDLAYQVDVLQPIWPPIMKRLRKELEKVADALGTEHDLAVLLEELQNARAEDRDKAMEDLTRELQVRRSEYQRTAYTLGRRIYAEKPKKFSKRIGAYWEAWRQ